MIHLVFSRRFWLKTIAIVAMVLVLLFVFAQTFLYFVFDENNLKRNINSFFNGTDYTITYTTNGFTGRSWFPSPNVNIYDVNIEDKQKKTLLYAKKINLRLSYKTLLGKKELSKISFYNSDFHLKKIDNNHNWNFVDIFDKNSQKSFRLPEKAIVRNGRLNYIYNKQYLQLENVNLDLKNINKKPELIFDGDIVYYNNKYLKNPYNLSLSTFINYSSNIITFNESVVNLHRKFEDYGDAQLDCTIPLVEWNKNNGMLNAVSVEFSGKSSWNDLSFHNQVKRIRFNLNSNIITIRSFLNTTQLKQEDSQVSSSLKLDNVLMQDNMIVAQLDSKTRMESDKYITLVNIASDFVLKDVVNFENISLNHAKFSGVQTAVNGGTSLLQTDLSGDVNYPSSGRFHADMIGTLDKQLMYINIDYDKSKSEYWQADVDAHMLDLSNYIKRGKDDIYAIDKANKFFEVLSRNLKRLNNHKIKAKINIGQLNIFNGKIDGFSTLANINRENIEFNEISANVYGGNLNGYFKMQNNKERFYTLKQEMIGVDVGQFLWDWTGVSRLHGSGSVYLDLNTQGNSSDALINNMRGDTVFTLQKGTLQGIDIMELMHNREHLLENLTQTTHQNFNPNANTDFESFVMLTKWHDGVGDTPALIFDSKAFNVGGDGSYRLKDKTADYALSLNGKLPDSKENIYLPLRITGKIDNLSYFVDYDSLRRDMRSVTERKRAIENIFQQQWNVLKPLKSN